MCLARFFPPGWRDLLSALLGNWRLLYVIQKSYVFLENFLNKRNSECMNWKVEISPPPSHSSSFGVTTTLGIVVKFLYIYKCITNWFGFGVCLLIKWVKPGSVQSAISIIPPSHFLLWPNSNDFPSQHLRWSHRFLTTGKYSTVQASVNGNFIISRLIQRFFPHRPPRMPSPSSVLIWWGRKGGCDVICSWTLPAPPSPLWPLSPPVWGRRN